MNESSSNENSIHIGIDLGTTNTVLASCKKPRINGYPKPELREITQYVMSSQIGAEKSLPSILFFDFDGVVKVGHFARERKNKGADRRILYNTKIDMGKKEIEYHNGYTPVKAATEILKCCYDTIRQIMPRGSEFPEVTITVPASFNQDQIADTKKAAEAAGFKKISILEEPLAALFDYINSQAISGGDIDFSKKKRLLVYDIGGGTCDVCVVDLQIDESGDYDFHFVLTNRYTELGGNDFDEQAAIGLLNKLFQRYNISEKEIASADIKNDLIAQILPYCEQYKIRYSNQLRNGYHRDEVKDAPFGDLKDFLHTGKNAVLDLPYAEYEKYTKIFFDKKNCRHPTRDLTDKMRDKNILRPVYLLLKELNEKGEDGIDYVFLTGGMSKYPPIEEALHEFCKCPVIIAEQPMDSVALGAAISKFIKYNKNDPPVSVENETDSGGKEQKNFDERPRLSEAIFIDVENQLPLKIIDADTAIPCKGEVDHVFRVGTNGVRFHLFAAKNQWDAGMRILYDRSQRFNPPVKPNTTAHIRYEIDEDRVLKLILALDDEQKQIFDLTTDTNEE